MPRYAARFAVTVMGIVLDKAIGLPCSHAKPCQHLAKLVFRDIDIADWLSGRSRDERISVVKIGFNHLRPEQQRALALPLRPDHRAKICPVPDSSLATSIPLVPVAPVIRIMIDFLLDESLKKTMKTCFRGKVAAVYACPFPSFGNVETSCRLDAIYVASASFEDWWP